ncbi:spermatid-specific manchette-related protein 1 isoform X3 [Ahaetulla prasina]|nr:spermatid-specific manchette-related protein 1 isoform X3 [Ahaetulla prasina]
MVKRAVQEYSYKNSLEPTAYRPYKYWVSREEEKFNPVFVGNDRYATWRTGPYNSAAWNRYTTYLPRIPREAGMDAILRGMPMEYPPKPERLNNYEREVVVNMLNSLSRKQLPYVQHQYSIPGRMPYQGYYSPCTGRHYCLRGMDYYVDGAPSTERQISQLVEKIVRFGGFGSAAPLPPTPPGGSFGGGLRYQSGTTNRFPGVRAGCPPGARVRVLNVETSSWRATNFGEVLSLIFLTCPSKTGASKPNHF